MAGYCSYLECLSARPKDPEAFRAWAVTVLGLFDRFRVLCAVREGPWGVSGLNIAIERSLAARDLIQLRSPWYEGRPVRVTRNNPALGVFNGDIGLVLRPPVSGQLRAYFFDGSELRSVSVSRLPDVDTAYAMTVHNSQGSEFGHVVLVIPDLDSPVLTRELLFTGITRSREALSLVSTDMQKIATAVRRSTTRFSGLRALLHVPGR
jgi:exodeoxyribonuclease V alpha subunit